MRSVPLPGLLRPFFWVLYLIFRILGSTPVVLILVLAVLNDIQLWGPQMVIGIIVMLFAWRMCGRLAEWFYPGNWRNPQRKRKRRKPTKPTKDKAEPLPSFAQVVTPPGYRATTARGDDSPSAAASANSCSPPQSSEMGKSQHARARAYLMRA